MVARVRAGGERKLKRCQRRRRRSPLQLQPGPQEELETASEELKTACEPPPPRKRKENSWISDATWALVDRRAGLRRQGKFMQVDGRRLGRQIRSSLKGDRTARTEKTAAAIKSELAGGNVQEAFHHLKGWYRKAGKASAPPCFLTMERQTVEREELYGKVTPPGGPIPINVDPQPINDDAPPDDEIRGIVQQMPNGRAGGNSFMRAEDMKEWLRGMKEEEDPEARGREGAGDRWRALVKLVQTIWQTGRIPRQLLWVIVVLIPKGSGGYRGIGLLEPVWKLLEAIMDRRLNCLELHDCLHGYRAKRGTGTAILEAKLAQQLAWLEQHPLYGIFIDLRKAFDAMDRERCLEILRGYGAGPNMLRLIDHFWKEAELVCRAEETLGGLSKPNEE